MWRAGCISQDTYLLYNIISILGDKATLVEGGVPHADEDGVEFAPLTMNCDIGIQKLFSEKVRSD